MKSAADRAIEHGLEQGLSRGRVEPTPACPDLELVAAWVDGSLLPAEGTRLEAHLAACGYCQTVVAGLARAEGAGQSAPRVAFRPAWWAWPLGAAAAVVLAVGLGRALVRVPDADVRPTLESVQSRAEGPPAAPEQTPPVRAPRPIEQARQQLERDRQVAEARPLGDQRRSVSDVPASPVAAVPPPDALDKSASPESASPSTTSAPRVDARQAATPEASTEGRPREEAQAAAVRPLAEASRSRALAASNAASGLVVAAPDGGWRWRVGRQLESTRDGAVWRASEAPQVASEVVAGHSPGGSTCWLVGRAGLVLHTVEGMRFDRRPAPTNDDLTFVRAMDADSAEVGTGDGRRWRTSDGGRTWTAQAR